MMEAYGCNLSKLNICMAALSLLAIVGRLPLGNAFELIKDEIRLGTSVSICNGEGFHFWLDPWLGRGPLHTEFSSMFVICSDHMLLMASFAHNGNVNIMFQ